MHELNLRLQDLPEWYRCAYLQDRPGVRITVHPAAAEFLCSQDIYRKGLYATIDPDAVARTGLPAFIPPSIGAPWGFGEALRPDPDSGWPGWSCAFPRVDVRDSQGWVLITALAVTLAELFEGLNLCDVPIDGSRRQAFTVKMSVRPRMPFHGYTLGAAVSGWWARYLAAHLSDPEDEWDAAERVIYATRSSYIAMFGDSGDTHAHWEETFRLDQQRRISFHIHGSACGLAYCHHAGGGYPSGGYGLEPINIDGPIQQLALLAGLAALSDHTRRDG